MLIATLHEFSHTDFSSSLFANINPGRVNYFEASIYTIDVNHNDIRKAKFCRQDVNAKQSIQRSQKITITDYKTLLLAAKQQPEPQRFLFVFLKASLPKDHDDKEARGFHAGRGGALEAVMCVDKDLNELGSFSDLIAESEAMGQEWQIVLVACFAGSNGIAPNADDAVQPLKRMIQTVESGGDLSKYMAFDRRGEPLQFA